MKQNIQIADKSTLDEIKSLLENNGYGLEALKSLIGNSSGTAGRYKPVQSLAVNNTTESLSFSGKGKIRILPNVDVSNSGRFIEITSLNVDGLPNHMSNLPLIIGNSTQYAFPLEIEYENYCNITLKCSGAASCAFIYEYKYTEE